MKTRQVLLITAITLIIYAFKVNNNLSVERSEIQLTIIKFDNQNPGFEYKADTLMKSKKIDLLKDKIDIFFCYRNFHIPYYMMTNSIYKDSIKERECNWKVYPATVKCYEYDSKGRVIKMQVEGSGTTGYHTFVYNDSNQIIEIQNRNNKYQMTYNTSGNLTKMMVDGGDIQKQLLFIYEEI